MAQGKAFQINSMSKASNLPRTSAGLKSEISRYSDGDIDPLRKRELVINEDRKSKRRLKHAAGHEKIRQFA